METLSTDGPPWHCDETDPADTEGPIASAPKAAVTPRVAAVAKPKSALAGPTLSRLDHFVIGLTLITAIGAIAGSDAGAPSHSYDLTPTPLISLSR